MRNLVVALIVAAAVALRLWMRARVRRGAAATKAVRRGASPSARPPRDPWLGEGSLGVVEMVARREIRERVRGRIFKVGTAFVLLAVVAAVVIPSLHGSGGPTTQTVGIVGALPPGAAPALRIAATLNHDVVKLVTIRSLSQAEAELRTGKLDESIVGGDLIVLNLPAAATTSSADAGFVVDVATYLGALHADELARLSPTQLRILARAKPARVVSLATSGRGANGTSIVGLVLLFFMLSQYNTWILIGVMQEKSSRVVEVLLATVRPLQLLAGKVAGIGLVALGQATLVVTTALVAGAAVGSDLLKGTAPTVLLCQLLWLVLGYGFYCWVYAAAGSTAERQDQVQTLALPLSIPILLGYVFSITVASTGSAGVAFKVLAYLPPTAPFAMPVLVGLRLVSWWQFCGSVLITCGSTVVVARLAARIYRRAILRTRGRIRLRELFAAARA